MVILKSVLAGIAAVVLVAITSLFVMGVYLWIRRPPDTGADLGAVGWDPISLNKTCDMACCRRNISGGLLLGVSSCHAKVAH